MLQGKFNTIRFDSAGCFLDIQVILGDLVIKYADLFCDIFQKNIVGATSLGPGKSKWREELKNHIKVQRFDISNAIIEAEVGFPEDLQSISEALFVKAMLVMYGSGSKSDFGGSPIHAGPKGRIVWDSDLTGKTASKQEEHALPDTWNHIGNHALQTTMLQMRKFFNDLLSEALREINTGLIQKHVSVIMG